MNWAVAVAVAWVILILPAGYLLGLVIRRYERRTAAAARGRRFWRRARGARLSPPGDGRRRRTSTGRAVPGQATAAPREEPLRRRGA